MQQKRRKRPFLIVTAGIQTNSTLGARVCKAIIFSWMEREIKRFGAHTDFSDK